MPGAAAECCRSVVQAACGRPVCMWGLRAAGAPRDALACRARGAALRGAVHAYLLFVARAASLHGHRKSALPLIFTCLPTVT